MSGKIKWNDFEGRPEDISKFLEISKINPQNLISGGKNIKTLNTILIVLLSIIIILFITHLFVGAKTRDVISLVAFFILLIEVFFVHRRWESTSLTIVAAIIALALFIVGTGLMTPDSALKSLIELLRKE